MSASSRVKSLESALDVLMAMPEDRTVSVTQLSKDVGLSKSAVYKILATFCDYGFVAQDAATREFCLGPTLISKGHRALKGIDLRQIVRPHLRYLSKRFGENSMLMVQQGDEALIVEYCEAEVPVRLAMQQAQRHKLYYGAAPKVLLAYKSPEEQAALIDDMVFIQHTKATITSKEKLYEVLAQIRQDGSCYSGGEFDNSGIGVAVPVWDANRRVTASIAMNVPMFRLKSVPLSQMIHEMKKCAVAVSETLGADGQYVREAIRLGAEGK